MPDLVLDHNDFILDIPQTQEQPKLKKLKKQPSKIKT